MSLQDDLKAYILHPAWLAVLEYAAQQRDQMDENLRFQGCTESAADFYRGKAAAYTELLSIQHHLMNPEPDHGD